MVIPAIAGTRRVIIMDRLRAHINPSLEILFRAHGHVFVLRPIHSPDFGPVEWVIGWIGDQMKKRAMRLTEENIADHLEEVIRSVSLWIVRGFYVDAGYLIPHRQYRPYTY